MLAQLAVPIGVSEAHGLLCGLLTCQPSGVAKGNWMAELLDASDLEPGSFSSKVEQIKTLDAWFSQVVESLNDADLQFNPELPDDSVPVSERLRALGDFCAGFSYGAGIATAGRGNKPLPEDSAELLKDFSEIDSSTSNETEGGSEDLLIELNEYVRVGVLLIHEELQPITTTESRIH